MCPQCIQAITCTQVIPLYFTRSMLGSRIDLAVLNSLFSEYLPQLQAHMESIGVPLELIASKWLVGLFTQDFPKATTLRIWDWFLLDGPDVLLFVMVAFFRSIADQVNAPLWARFRIQSMVWVVCCRSQ